MPIGVVRPSLSCALVCTLFVVSAPYGILAKFSSFHLPQLYIFPASQIRRKQASLTTESVYGFPTCPLCLPLGSITVTEDEIPWLAYVGSHGERGLVWSHQYGLESGESSFPEEVLLTRQK